MKKKHHHKKRHRNNGGGGGGGGAPHPRPRSHTPRPSRQGGPPGWKTIGVAVAGGLGSAALGGLLVNQKILSPEAVGLGLMLGGGATARFSDGLTQIFGFSTAAVGAGQLALGLMAKQAVKGTSQPPPPSLATNQSGQPAAQLPAPPPAVEPPRRSDSGGGIVLDLFRDAATDLDMLDDQWRYGMRDDAEPIVIDLDEAA
jgi:hypothetical protein